MLITQFLNDDERKHLLDIAQGLSFSNKSIGSYAKNHDFKNIKDKVIENVINRTYDIILKEDKAYQLSYDESFFLKVNNFGWVSAHVDGLERNLQVMNFNILLQKPKQGGIILHNNSKVIMEEKDLYIVDASILHGLSSIKSNDEYYSLVLWFFKKIR